MPFGLTNAPATFQRSMNAIFSDLLDECIVVYLDDILVFSKSKEEHIKHLKIAFERLRKHEFYAKLKKCEFFKERITFLGHDIDANGIHINASKIASIRDWPTPKKKDDI
jgi:Reverse transcriptase (RNA-dependent DNA polymerase)